MYIVTKRARFEAAHQLQGYEGKCKNLHGHSYQVQVQVARKDGDIIQEGPNRGMVFDLAELGRILKEIINEVDHTKLNDHAELEVTTAEEIAAWIARRVSKELPDDVKVIRCKVWETKTGAAEWRHPCHACK